MSQDYYVVVMVRHGESDWNQQNRFTGWTDVDLSTKGIQEAHDAGKKMKAEGYTFDIAFTSVLKRAIKTLGIVQDEMDLDWLPVVRHWRLNERHYGALQGLNKAETAAKHGEDQVLVWRRAYDIAPPPLELSDPRHPANDRRYASLDPSLLPQTECLKDTVQRVLPFWFDSIVPAIKDNKRVLIAAHGNSLRALTKYLDNMTDAAVVELNIPTGIPLVYHLDKKTMKPLKHFYLADDATVAAAIAAVKGQGAKK